MGGAVLVCSALALKIEVEAALEVEVRGGLDEVVDDSIVACSWGRWRCPKLTGLYLADRGVEREAVETGLNGSSAMPSRCGPLPMIEPSGSLCGSRTGFHRNPND